jgi:hypothetical protein
MPINTGLTNANVFSFAVVGTNLFAGTGGGAVWRRPLSEVTSLRRAASEVPGKFSLLQNYPNPFNPSTTITIALPHDAHVSLEVYNTLGQKVAQLLDELMTAGYHSVTFDASRLASGVYLYKMKAGDYVATKKLLLLK